jgi:Ni2+-binding GTPase involved in maturation of urease and hydrogenase
LRAITILTLTEAPGVGKTKLVMGAAQKLKKRRVNVGNIVYREIGTNNVRFELIEKMKNVDTLGLSIIYNAECTHCQASRPSFSFIEYALYFCCICFNGMTSLMYPTKTEVDRATNRFP